MSEKKMIYSISGYRYAPESFRAYCSQPNGGKKEIPLSVEEQSGLGYCYITKGSKAALDYIKNIDRERQRKCRLYMAYGFWTQEDPKVYLYSRQIIFRADAPLSRRFEAYRGIKDCLRETNGKVKTGATCTLDGYFCPTDVKELYLTADFGSPVIIRLLAG
ncbi:MAG: hypothetical protein PHY23_01035 [Oscillospiraceae bacterium]|nr:hypothetical protein [Oscillospiraceae bacterium]